MRYPPEALARAHSEDPIPFNVAGIPLHACQHVDRPPSSTARFVTAAHGRLILEADLPRPAVAAAIYSFTAIQRANGSRAHSSNFLMASALTGVKKLTRFPSGSRNRSERLPHGIVVGS